ncbi:MULTISPECIES: type I polyketide synthase [unclassified Xanthobacter]|uniref:type I polyketide synthase n=1 Tax=unclassified Xanthobacter TaxID=2623496 RepID=UPI001EDE0869|nr:MULTISPECIES: type I polyketide synthase [unclassified Xanthobacter]
MNDMSAPIHADASEHHVAVIGMAGRFPGAQNVGDFAQNLFGGVDSIPRWSRDALRANGVSEAQLDLPDFVAAGGPLEGADRFDAAFFGYSPAEAEILDPQQRVFLECAWAALETAGYAGGRRPGATAVFAAAGINTYLLNLHDNARIRGTVSPYELFVSNDKDFLATRTAFKLDLRGPAVTVQSACSSSLVAVHLAVQSLLAGDCDMALAGGVSLSQASGYRAREGGILSPDGHCRAFDASAAGTVPGSGVGIVVLKRLADALADGDAIDAVIIGSAINNDGALKASFTAPQVDSQAAVIADALAMAGVNADSIGYVEAHGTGTALGDPIEVAALTQAFRRHTTRSGFCALGSVKSNIGHLDTAAGVTGFIKAVLAVRQGQLPPSLHYEQPNPRIDFAASPFYVNTHLRTWESGGQARRAGVSSFGIGGTNAHVILEEAPQRPAPSTGTGGPQLVTLSARDAAALSRSATALAADLDAPTAPDLADTAFTLRAGRTDFPHRQFVVASDAATAAARLRALSSFDETARGPEPEPVFLFPGQGTSYAAMGRSLHAGLPAFRMPFETCADRLDHLMGLDFRQHLFSGDDAIYRTDVAQPALFAVSYALARTWMAHGVAPRAMHGHSIGEYVAACLAGVFDLDAALALVVARGRLMQRAPAGAMLAIIHPDQEVEPWLSADIALAAANAPGLSVVSGARAAIADLQRRLKQDGVASRLLKTSHAFHSPMMGEAADAFRAVLRDIPLAPPRIPLISNVTGTWMTDEQATDPDYWVRHLLEPVRFEAGTRTLLSLPAPLFIEVGPGRTLSTLTAQTAPATVPCIATLGDEDRREEAEQVLTALGRCWQLNGALDLPAARGARRVPLPTYPFQGERFWVRPDEAAGPAAAEAPGPTLYRTTWHRQPPAAAKAAPLKGRVLIFDDGRIGTALAQILERTGAEPYRVIASDQFAEPDYRCFALRPGEPADYASLLATLAERGAPPDHLLFAWPLRPRPTATPLNADACAMLAVVTALAHDERHLSLTLLTRCAADVTGLEDLDAAQALVGGVMPVVGQEHPHLAWRHIDIEATDALPPEQVARHICDELGRDGRTVALRGPHRWLPEMERLEPSKADGQAGLLRNGVYAMMGDLTGPVGQAWRDGLSAWPGVRLALLQDSGAPSLETADTLRIPLNGTDTASLDAALDAVVAACGRVDGVFLSMPQSDRASAAPITALQDAHWQHNLDTLHAPLQALIAAAGRRRIGFCCIQSSLSVAVGGPSLAAYAATHQAMDLLVARQDRTGPTRWFAIGYPRVAPDAGGHPRAGAATAAAVSPATAWALTSSLIDAGCSGQTMLSANGRPFIGAVATAVEPIGATGGRSRPALATAFLAPRTPAEATVVEIFKELLGLERVGVNDGFYELGGHSLLAIRAVAKLRDAFPVDIAMRDLLFDNPTAAEIAATLTARIAENTDLHVLADLLDEVGSLSDDEVGRLIAGSDAR